LSPQMVRCRRKPRKRIVRACRTGGELDFQHCRPPTRGPTGKHSAGAVTDNATNWQRLGQQSRRVAADGFAFVPKPLPLRRHQRGVKPTASMRKSSGPRCALRLRLCLSSTSGRGCPADTMIPS
jgi:hypothetical protein